MKSSFSKSVSYLMALLMTSPLARAAGSGQIDVSGQGGSNGQDGHSYYGSASSGFWGMRGSNGDNGGDASRPSDGQNAGEIQLQAFRPQVGVMAIKAFVTHAGGGSTNVDTNFVIGKSGSIFLNARGGDGGNGGQGGKGEDGGTGGRGSDATEMSSGGNGGDGGRGGNGGHGTSGANGGRGGRIVVELPEKDTALLMLVEHDVSAGRGGRAGQHGQPGSGGSGGSGGSSYSWTTYEGSGNDRRSVSHSQSGGWSGSSGSSGSSPSDYLSQGRDGAEGSYQIRVLTEEGVKTYDRAYNLNLVDYNLIPESKNGILEPGEKVFVHNLRVRNTGGMPTPRFTKIRIFLRNSEYSIADSMELEIPKSLAPNEVYTFAGNSLSFVIKNNIFRTAQEDRTRWDDHIQPLAQMTEVERSFNQFSAPRSIEITYPVEIEPIITSRSVAPGEKTQVLLRIKNISTADFGSTSELQRELAVFLRKTSGDLATSNFKLVDEQGRDLNMQEGILKAVDHLKAGESALIAGQLEIGPQAEPFSRAEIGFRLDIGTPKGATAKTSIQDRHVNFSISQVYRRDPSANVLLVVNSGIDKERSWALKKMIENVGLKPAIWDLSYYGEISLTKMLDHGSSFAEDFKGMNIVIANNIFEVNQGVTSAAQYISHRELAEAASKKGIGVLILGGDAGSVIDNTNKVSIEKRPNISVSKWRLWGKPSEDQMTEEANDLLNDISKKDPSGNYVVVHSFSPQLLKTAFGGILKTWSLGNLEVHRSLDTRHASIVAVNVGQGGNLTPSDIYSRSTEVAFAMSLSVDKRMKILNEKLKSSNAEDVNIAYVIAQSLIMSVVEEQSALRRLQWYTNFTYRELDVRMPHLNAILKGAESILANSSSIKAQQLWIGLLSGLKLVSKDPGSWWIRQVPLRMDAAISELATKKLTDLEDKIFPKAPWYRQARTGEFSKKDLKQIEKTTEAIRPETKVQSGNAARTNNIQSKEDYSNDQWKLEASESGAVKKAQSLKSDNANYKERKLDPVDNNFLP